MNLNVNLTVQPLIIHLTQLSANSTDVSCSQLATHVQTSVSECVCVTAQEVVTHCCTLLRLSIHYFFFSNCTPSKTDFSLVTLELPYGQYDQEEKHVSIILRNPLKPEFTCAISLWCISLVRKTLQFTPVKYQILCVLSFLSTISKCFSLEKQF